MLIPRGEIDLYFFFSALEVDEDLVVEVVPVVVVEVDEVVLVELLDNYLLEQET